jgi:hypothetical protein
VPYPVQNNEFGMGQMTVEFHAGGQRYDEILCTPDEEHRHVGDTSDHPLEFNHIGTPVLHDTQ